MPEAVHKHMGEENAGYTAGDRRRAGGEDIRAEHLDRQRHRAQKTGLTPIVVREEGGGVPPQDLERAGPVDGLVTAESWRDVDDPDEAYREGQEQT